MYKLLPPAEGSSYSVATVLASNIHGGSTKQDKKKEKRSDFKYFDSNGMMMTKEISQNR